MILPYLLNSNALLEALEGLSTQRGWHGARNAEIKIESSVRGGPALLN